ncbi:hypothetical protein VTI74DRAFT_3258 [Chaetomium olivicolor]
MLPERCHGTSAASIGNVCGGGLPARAIALMRSTDADDQFLAGRLLLLSPPIQLQPSCLTEHGALAETINAATARHASTANHEAQARHLSSRS